MVLGRRSLPFWVSADFAGSAELPLRPPDCPNVWTPTWKGLGGDPFVGGWFMNHPIFYPWRIHVFWYIYLHLGFGFDSHHCNKGKKVGGSHSWFFFKPKGKNTYIYICVYIYKHTYYIHRSVGDPQATVTNEEMSKLWRCDIRNEKSNKRTIGDLGWVTVKTITYKRFTSSSPMFGELNISKKMMLLAALVLI